MMGCVGTRNKDSKVQTSIPLYFSKFTLDIYIHTISYII